MKIGLDLDNTIIQYDKLFQQLAMESTWLTAPCPKTKNEVRTALRRTEDGQVKWEQLQALAYGPRIQDAELSRGFHAFLEQATLCNIELCIISHKTEFAAQDFSKNCSLRRSAKSALEDWGVLGTHENMISHDQLTFANTRSEKVSLIKAQKCDIFVDDLKEVFLDPHFSKNIKKIWFKGNTSENHQNWSICQDWSQVWEHVKP